MINYKNGELVSWSKSENHKMDSELSSMIIQNQNNSSVQNHQPQNITLQVNGEEEEKFFLKNNESSMNIVSNDISTNQLKLNHGNGLSQSYVSLNQFIDLPSSTQLSLNSLSSDNCIHAEAGRLFHQQLDKELSKVIPSSQRRKTSIETVQDRFKFNMKRKKNSLTNVQNPVKQSEENLDIQINSNCPSIYEPLISNSTGLKNQLEPSYKDQYSTNQFDQTNLLDPNAAKLTKESNSIQSIFSVQPTNLLKPPCSRATTASIGNFASKTATPNLSIGAKNRLNLIDSSNSNLKADLSPANLRRRCIAKNGTANIRNAKISRKSQRFFLDFFNTMIDIEWHYNLLFFTLSFVVSWLFFALIWYSIAYQHGDLYRIEELDEVAVDLDKMNMNLNFLTDNIDNLNTENVLSKSKRSLVGFEDQDKILNNLAYSILNNRNSTTFQQMIEHFNLSKLRLNSTSGTNIYHKMEDGTNLTQFLSYAKNNPKLKETFASHNISLNKIAKLVQPKRLYFNVTNQRTSNEQNDLKLLNNVADQSIIQTNNPEDAQQQQSLIMNTVATNEEHLPQFPIANLTNDQRHQLENLFYLMQLQYLLQQERNKQQIAKFLTKLAKKAHHNNLINKPSHPPQTPPIHPLPSITAIEEEEQLEKEAKHKEQERKELEKKEKEKQQDKQKLINEALINEKIKEQENLINLQNLQNLKNDPNSLPSTDEVIAEAVEKASETVLPKCGLNGTKSCRKVCLDNINSFADALLFSIETQHTIGYGTRQPRDCKIVLAVLMVQSIFGCLIQCFVVGFVFAKLSRPQNRHQTLVFSKRAVINLSEYDQTYDFAADMHNNDNQFNLNFEELNDLVNLMKSGEMQEIHDCGCGAGTATNSETGSDQVNRRHSSGAISTDDLLLQQHSPSSLQGSNLNSFNQLKDYNLLNNFLNLPSSKRCSNVSFLNTGVGLSSLQTKVSNNLNSLNLCSEIEHNVDYTGNKNYRLEFRLGDVREKSHIINARISAYFLNKENYYFKNDLLPKSNKFKYQLFKKRQSEVDYSNLKLSSTLNTAKAYNYNELVIEKKMHNFTQKKLALTIDNVEHSDGELLLIWPIVVSHEINERSPLYNISKEELMNSKFEIVIVLEGTIESTGQSVQARTSYLPSEINWGEKLLPVLQSDNEDAEFLVNFSMFNMTKRQHNMPNFSSREYQLRKKFHKLCMLKKYLSKLSDTELECGVDEQNADKREDDTNNLNLLRYLLNQNDKYNLINNGLINNMDDLNNLNNLYNTLNKLVSHNGSNSSNNSANGFFESKNLSFSSFNNTGNNQSGNQSSNNQSNNNQTNHLNHNQPVNKFYQQSRSVDQTALNRKKSTDISNLLDILHNNGQFKESDKSRSFNFLNNLNKDQMNQHSSNSVNYDGSNNLMNNVNHKVNQKVNHNHKTNQSDASLVNHLNQINNQMNQSNKKHVKRNDSEHITIEQDDSPERKRWTNENLKLLTLFQPSSNSKLNSNLISYDNQNYNENYKVKTESNEIKLNQEIKKLKDQKFKNLNISSKLKAPKFGKSETYLNNVLNEKSTIHNQKTSNSIGYNLDRNLDSNKSRSDWNLSVAKKRQIFKSNKK